MKERPIIFSAPMVRAVLAGRKTQTRRVVKGLAAIADLSSEQLESMELAGWREWAPGYVALPTYGAPGDRLWVRETWKPHSTYDSTPPRGIPALTEIYYAADDAYAPSNTRWRSPIHMPRAASRITLEIVAVRVERLNDISPADAIAEGGPPSHPSIDAVSREFGYADFSRSWYAQTWERINGADSWEANPWVWVIEFRRAK